jgi:hypothetical protein
VLDTIGHGAKIAHERVAALRQQDITLSSHHPSDWLTGDPD